MEAFEPKRMGDIHNHLLVLMDTSKSMGIQAINELQQSINNFKNRIIAYPRIADVIDVCVLGFNNKPYLIQNWRSLSDMNDIHLEIGNGTNLSLALEESIKKIRERSLQAYENGIEIRVPTIILITDGYDCNIDEISNVIRKKQEEKKLKLYFVGVKGYDRRIATMLVNDRQIISWDDDMGKEFFDNLIYF